MLWLIRHRFGVWAFAVAVAFIPGIMSAAVLGRWSAVALGAPLVGPFKPDRLPAPCQYALAAGLAWAAASLLIAPDPAAALLELFFILALVGVLLAFSRVDTLNDALTGLALGLGISSVLCLIDALFGLRVVAMISARPAGLFYNSEVLAEFAAPVLIWTILARRPLLAVAVAPSVLLSGSRIALFVIVVMTVVETVRRWGLRAALSWVVLAAPSGWYLAIYSSQHGVSSVLARSLIWTTSLYAVTPLGLGLGWFMAVFPQWEYAHSDLLQGFVELGVGAVFFAFVPAFILLTSRGNHAERAALLCLCLEACVSFPLHTPAAGFLAAMLAGFLLARCGDLYVPGPVGRALARAHGAWRSADTGNDFEKRGSRGCAVPIRPTAAQHAALARLHLTGLM